MNSRNDYFYSDDTRFCQNTRTLEFCEDCVVLANGDYAYYGIDCEGYDGVYMCEHAKEEGFRYDVHDMEWYDPKEQDDVSVLNWDFKTGRRKRAYTRRKNIGTWNITRYKNNYYVGYLKVVANEDDDTLIPRELA